MGVRIEEGAERGQRSGAFPPRAFRAAHGAPATAREARSAIECALGCGGPARPRPSVLSREARGGGVAFRRERVVPPRQSSRPPVCAWPQPSLQASQRPHTPTGC